MVRVRPDLFPIGRASAAESPTNGFPSALLVQLHPVYRRPVLARCDTQLTLLGHRGYRFKPTRSALHSPSRQLGLYGWLASAGRGPQGLKLRPAFLMAPGPTKRCTRCGPAARLRGTPFSLPFLPSAEAVVLGPGQPTSYQSRTGRVLAPVAPCAESAASRRSSAVSRETLPAAAPRIKARERAASEVSERRDRRSATPATSPTSVRRPSALRQEAATSTPTSLTDPANTEVR
jgi:hypothetical protein